MRILTVVVFMVGIAITGSVTLLADRLERAVARVPGPETPADLSPALSDIDASIAELISITTEGQGIQKLAAQVEACAVSGHKYPPAPRTGGLVFIDECDTAWEALAH